MQSHRIGDFNLSLMDSLSTIKYICVSFVMVLMVRCRTSSITFQLNLEVQLQQSSSLEINPSLENDLWIYFQIYNSNHSLIGQSLDQYSYQFTNSPSFYSYNIILNTSKTTIINNIINTQFDLSIVFGQNVPTICVYSASLDNSSLYASESYNTSHNPLCTTSTNSSNYNNDNGCKYLLFSNIYTSWSWNDTYYTSNDTDDDSSDDNTIIETMSVVESNCTIPVTFDESWNNSGSDGNKNDNLTSVEIIGIIALCMIGAFFCAFCCWSAFELGVFEYADTSDWKNLNECPSCISVILSLFLGWILVAGILCLVSGPIIAIIGIFAKISSGWLTFAYIFTGIDVVFVVYLCCIICGGGGTNL